MQEKYNKYFLNIKKNCPQYAQNALTLINKNNYDAWIVGGFVRDCIIEENNKQPIKNAINKFNNNDIDIDVATSAKPDVVTKIFKSEGWTVVPTGIKHGTITVIYNPKPHPTKNLKDSKKYQDNNHQTIEITTYRQDSEYSDHRHPDKVKFAKTIKQDLSRRDFTMNAVAFNFDKGIYDPFYGIVDIERKTIRTIGTPHDRFCEDALRILRACRFVSTLGFKVDKETRYAIARHNKLLNNISKERIASELTKLLCGSNVYKSLMMFKRVMCTCIPEISPTIGFDQKTKYHCYDIYEHTAVTVSNMPVNKYINKTDKKNAVYINEIGRWAALLHDIGKPETFFTDKNGVGHFYGHPKASKKIANEVLKNFKFSKKFRKSVCALVRWHDRPTKVTKKSIKRMLKRLSKYKGKINLILQFRVLCDLRKADALAHAPKYRNYVDEINKIESFLDSILVNEEVFTKEQLEINGHDLINIGIKPGPEINIIIEKLTDACIDGKVANNKEALLKYAQKSQNTKNNLN